MKQRNPVARASQRLRTGAGRHQDKRRRVESIPFEYPEPVRVVWFDPDSDWNYFWLLEMRGEWLKLQGRDHPDGWKHDGDVFWAHCSKIKHMEVEV